MGDRIRAYIQRAIGRQKRPAEMQKGMPAAAGAASLGVASVQPPAKARRTYSMDDAFERAVGTSARGGAAGARDPEAENEPLSDEEQALLDRSKGSGRHARRAAEVYAQQYRRQ